MIMKKTSQVYNNNNNEKKGYTTINTTQQIHVQTINTFSAHATISISRKIETGLTFNKKAMN